MPHVRNVTVLPVIEIQAPCQVDWDTMQGGERGRRFCAHCQRHVHDLSAMRRDEVADLMCRKAGELCVRFERTPDGQVRTLDYAPPVRGIRLREWLSVGFVGTLIALVAGAVAIPMTRPMGMIRRPIVRPPLTPAGTVGAPTATPASTGEATCPTP